MSHAPRPDAPSTTTSTTTTTLINVFSVAPEDRDRLAALLLEGTRDWICRVPGFVSSSLHASRDGRRVVIVGEWRDAGSIAAMRQHPAMPGYLERVRALATMEAMTCDEMSTTHAPETVPA